MKAKGAQHFKQTLVRAFEKMVGHLVLDVRVVTPKGPFRAVLLLKKVPVVTGTVRGPMVPALGVVQVDVARLAKNRDRTASFKLRCSGLRCTPARVVTAGHILRGPAVSTSSDYVRVMDQRLCQWLLCQANSYPVR